MIASLVVVVHILAAMWLVAGIVGRSFVFRQVARTTDLSELRALVVIGSRFERAMVRPATGFVLLLGLIAAWLRGWPILGFLQGGHSNWVLASLLIYLTIIPVIVFVFVPRGAIYRKALDEAAADGTVTPRLRAALNDPVVGAARAYEILMVVVLTVLMVTKPF